MGEDGDAGTRFKRAGRGWLRRYATSARTKLGKANAARCMSPL